MNYDDHYYLMHSKGDWAVHKYIKKIGKRYYYAKEKVKKKIKSVKKYIKNKFDKFIRDITQKMIKFGMKKVGEIMDYEVYTYDENGNVTGKQKVSDMLVSEVKTRVTPAIEKEVDGYIDQTVNRYVDKVTKAANSISVPSGTSEAVKTGLKFANEIGSQKVNTYDSKGNKTGSTTVGEVAKEEMIKAGIKILDDMIKTRTK